MIPNIPAGRYRLQLWHPRRKARKASSEITVDDAPVKLKLVLDVKPRDPRPRAEADPDRY